MLEVMPRKNLYEAYYTYCFEIPKYTLMFKKQNIPAGRNVQISGAIS